jgi:surfeit locus 1 family protein
VKRVLLLLLSAACIAGFVRLGFWQLDRAVWKEALLAHSHQVIAQRKAEPLAAVIDAPAPAGDENAYAWASGSGHFLPLPAVLLDNQTHEGHYGVRVYRVFQPDGARRAVLLELGWRPMPTDRKLPPEPLPSGSWPMEGLLSPPPSPGLSLGGGGVQRQPDGSLLMMRLQPASVATALGLGNGLATRVLRPDPKQPLGYVRDLDVLGTALPPAQHRGYAVQWFGMAAGLLVATIVVARRKSYAKET